MGRTGARSTKAYNRGNEVTLRNGHIDQRTNGPTDRPSYRDARTHLEMIGSGVGGIELMIDGFSKKGNGRMDRPIDGWTDRSTDGRTNQP